jgi:hypothetical protein
MADGTMHVEWDRHVEGLFARADWLRILRDTGFAPRVLSCDPCEFGPGHEVFVCRKAGP